MNNNLTEGLRPDNGTDLLPQLLPPFVTIPLGALIGACVVVGLPVKFVFYRYLSDTGAGGGSAPQRLFGAVNKMIFFEQARNTMNTISYWMTIHSGKNLPLTLF